VKILKYPVWEMNPIYIYIHHMFLYRFSCAVFYEADVIKYQVGTKTEHTSCIDNLYRFCIYIIYICSDRDIEYEIQIQGRRRASELKNYSNSMFMNMYIVIVVKIPRNCFANYCASM
jgi:activator of 2-hydroxyglutaryl-CoA dehydratase